MTKIGDGNDFFKFRRLYELQRGQVFKLVQNGVFYRVLIKEEESILYQTLFGKIKTFNKRLEAMDIEVLFFPNR